MLTFRLRRLERGGRKGEDEEDEDEEEDEEEAPYDRFCFGIATHVLILLQRINSLSDKRTCSPRRVWSFSRSNGRTAAETPTFLQCGGFLFGCFLLQSRRLCRVGVKEEVSGMGSSQSLAN